VKKIQCNKPYRLGWDTPKGLPKNNWQWISEIKDWWVLQRRISVSHKSCLLGAQEYGRKEMNDVMYDTFAKCSI